MIAFALVFPYCAAQGSPSKSFDSTASEVPPSDASSAVSASETLYLEVHINGQPTNKIGEFVLRHGQLMAREEVLRNLGLTVPNSRIAIAGGLIALSDLPGVIWQLNQADQVLLITATDASLRPVSILPFRSEASPQRLSIQSGNGITFNYDVVDSFSNQGSGASGSLDLQAFSPWGVASSKWLAYAGSSTTNSSGATRLVRLDTVYTFSDVNTLRRISAGDFIDQGLSWTRSVHLAGVQIRSDFSMRPDLVTFPLPTIKGSTSVPTTVNVLADGNLVASSQVAAGPFQVSQLPVVSGAGTISMTMTNALGQQVTITQPFYASSQLLAPGLQTYSGEIGFVRRDWGSASENYGKLAGNLVYRRGLTSTFTFEGTAEGTPGAFMASSGGILQARNLGVVSLSLAGSSGPEGDGFLVSGGVQRVGRVFSIGANAIMATKGYADIASMNGDGTQRKLIGAYSSLYSRHVGSVGLAYNSIDRDAPIRPIAGGSTFPLHTRVLNGTYSFPLRHALLYASEFRDLENAGESGLQVGITIPIHRRSSIDINGSSNGPIQIQAQQSATEIGEWGYQAYASVDGSNHIFAQSQYMSSFGLYTAGVDENDGRTTVQLESQGALSLVDGALFPSNTIYDSFAIVDTSPIPHVHVLEENRNVGVTSGSGRLLVPDMRSFELNHIAVKPTDITVDASLSDPSKWIRPQDHSGVVVKFPITWIHAALLHLVDAEGKSIPVGSIATLQANGSTVPVGYDGEAYVQGLVPFGNVVLVQTKDGNHCHVTFNYKAVPGDIPSIGPLRCLEHQP